MDIQETTFNEWKKFIGIIMTPKGYLYKGKFYNSIELYNIYLSENKRVDEIKDEVIKKYDLPNKN